MTIVAHARWWISMVAAAGCGGSSAAPAAAHPPPPAHPPAGELAEHRHPGGSGGGGMPHRFDDAESWARVFDDPARDAWQKPDEVVGLLTLSPGMLVADIGAGTGYFVGRLSAAVGAGGQVIATDVEPDMVRYLGERGARDGWTNVRAVHVAPDDPGLAAASVDRILVVDVWHHLPDRKAYAARLAATLRPGGLIAVVDFTLDAERGPPPAHRLAPAALVADLTSAGLTVDIATETLPDQYVVIARRAR